MDLRFANITSKLQCSTSGRIMFNTTQLLIFLRYGRIHRTFFFIFYFSEVAHVHIYVIRSMKGYTSKLCASSVYIIICIFVISIYNHSFRAYWCILNAATAWTRAKKCTTTCDGILFTFFTRSRSTVYDTYPMK